jgi:hypothetical protein
MKDGNRRRSYFTEPSRSSGGRAQSSEGGVLAAKEHKERKEDGGANRGMGRRRTEGWPQKAQEGTKGGDRRRGRGPAETEFLTTKHMKDGDRRRGWNFLTTAERGSAEVVTLISVARNEVEGD